MRASKPGENGSGDLALKSLEGLRDGLDVLHLGSMPASDEDRAADPRRDDVGVRAIESRRGVVDHDAVVALRALRQIQELLRAQKLLRMRRGRSGDEQRKPRDDVDGDRRLGVATSQRLDQSFRLRLRSEDRGEFSASSDLPPREASAPPSARTTARGWRRNTSRPPPNAARSRRRRSCPARAPP